MKTSPSLRRRRPAPGSSLEPLEARIAPASVVSVVTGNLSVFDGANGADTIAISVNGGNFHFSDPGGITAGAGATPIDAQNVEVPIAAVTGSFSVQTNGGNDSITFSTALSTAGDLTVDTGTGADFILVGGALTPGGHANLTSAGGITFNNAVTLTANKNLTVTAGATGTVSVAAALTTSGTGAIQLTGQDVTGAGAIATDGGLTVSNTGSASTLSGVISRAGGLTKLGLGTLALSVANTYTGTTNVNAGTLLVNGSLADGAAATDVTVAGGATLGGTGTLGGSVSNSGTVQAASGTLRFNAGFDNGGVVDALGGTLMFGGTFSQTAGSTNLAGGALATAGTLSFAGGVLTGAGTITGDVSNTGATVRPGGTSTAGTIVISGAYTQGAGGALAAELGGTGAGQFDVLSVGGTATLGGTLNATLLGGFTPPFGSTYQILGAGTRSGTFTTTNLPAGFSASSPGATVVLAAPPDPLVVTTTADVVNAGDGVTSLREAITFANGNAGLDTITFNIPGGGVQTIAPASGLPNITEGVVINGYSQPGASVNTLAVGDNAVLLIEINGSGAGTASGLTLVNSNGSLIRGLIINRFPSQSGISLSGAASTGNVIQGNFLGTDATGTLDFGNNLAGVNIQAAPNTTVGGTLPEHRNLISGNSTGIAVSGTGAIIQGNYIGTNAAGTAVIANVSAGVSGGAGFLLGGTTPGARNVISGNLDGVVITGGAACTVQGNFIGTDATGTLDLGNTRDGIAVRAGTGNLIGGTQPEARNLISGNNDDGIDFAVGAPTGTLVQGNFIGLSVNGTALGNSGNGIEISNNISNNTIGGTAPGAGNAIAFNTIAGVAVLTGTGNAIRGNSIFSNTARGIDLGTVAGPNGVTANDAGDGDTGANNLQNFPVLTSVMVEGGATFVRGTLNSTANTAFNLEFFRSPAADSSGFGEGQTLLGLSTITTDGSGNAPFAVSFTGAFVSEFFTATASRTGTPLDTSEFSPAVPAAALSPLVVTTTADSVASDGVTSLREAIAFANGNPGLDTITFNIPGGGVKTIAPTNALPTIVEAVVIDGYTQPGASANTNGPGLGSNAVLLIELDGTGASANTSGLTISAGGSKVAGLAINRFTRAGLELNGGSGSTIEGNFIGTNASGTASLGNGIGGVFIGSGATGNTIGGSLPGARNLISGNNNGGINISSSSNNSIVGNFIGPDITGSLDLGNTGAGVVVASSAGTTIGGGSPAARNVISGNNSEGIQIGGASSGSLIQGNFIGTNAAGTLAIGNGSTGILSINVPNLTIGGPAAGAGNVISGNGAAGIVINNALSNNVTVQGNFVGTEASGSGALPNLGPGVRIQGATNSLIGGTAAGAGNVIAFNQGHGVTLEDFNGPPTGLAIRGNAIFGNTGLGINLEGGAGENVAGVTPNDAGDADAGPNGLQNFPVITSAVRSATGTAINATLNSTPGAAFLIDFYASAAADTSGFGEGQIYLGSTTAATDGAGNVTFTFNSAALAPAGGVITATATSAGNDTSEFSQAQQARSIFTWDNSAGTGDWFNAANWDLDSGTPGALDTAILNLAATVTLGGAGATVLAFQQSAGTLAGSAQLTVTGSLVWSGGAMTGSGTTRVDPAAIASLSGAADHQLTGRTLDNAGTLNWSGAGQLVLDGATINNSGAFNLLSDATMAVGSASVFNHSGTFAKTGGGGTSVISLGITVNHSGTVRASSGTLDLGNAFTQTAGATELAGGQLQSAGTLVFSGGELRGAGTITGSVNNTGATVRPGGTGAAGTITITGAYTQGAGGALAAELGGTGAGQFDVLSVGGTASLGGTLNATLLGGFTPPLASMYPILGAGTRSGTFATANLPAGFSISLSGAAVVLIAPLDPLLVTTTADVVNAGDGVTSLREAIAFANGNAGLDTITFDIAGGGVKTIAPTSALPTITEALVIDGYTQRGAGVNTAAAGTNAVLLIELNGATAGASANGLTLTAGGSTIRGLVINGFAADGIRLTGATADGNVLEGNFIGTNASGGAGPGITGAAVFIDAGAENNLVGGTTLAARNLLSSSLQGVFITGAGSGGNTIRGNLIGTDASGTVALPNTSGIHTQSPGALIGGSGANEGNVLSGNSFNGIHLDGPGASGAIILGNLIGTSAAGTADLGNHAAGIRVDRAADTTIGGTQAGAGNVIAFNAGDGVNVAGAATGNRIRGNSIFGNALLGINLSGGTGETAAGVTPNDATDADAGPNGLLNFPVLGSAVGRGASTTIAGTFHSTGSGTFLLDFYANAAADPSGFGEGRIYLGATAATANAAGDATFTFSPATPPPPGSVITATATDAGGNTSEFSGGAALTIRFIWDAGGGADTSWFNPLNWDRDSSSPGATDTATLNIGATITLGADATVAAFQHSAGTLGGAAKLTVLTSYDWSGGALAGGGTTAIASGATLAISGAGLHLLSGHTIENRGTITWTGAGSLRGDTAANEVNNLSGAVFNAQNDGLGEQTGGGTLTINNLAGATFTKSGAGTTSAFGLETTFNHDGALSVASGTLLVPGGASGGAFAVSVGATLAFAGSNPQNLTATSGVSGAGTVSVSGGTTNLAGSYALTGGTTVSGGTLNFNTNASTGSATLLSGTIGGTGPLTSARDFDVRSGTIGASLAGNVGLTKTTSATVTLAGANSYTGLTTISAGTLQFDAVGSALNGAFSLGGGTLIYNLPGAPAALTPAITLTADSSIAVAAGKMVALNGVLSGPGGLIKTGAGALALGNEFNTFGPAAVTIAAGALQVATDGALGEVTNAVIILDQATLQTTASFASARHIIRPGGVGTIQVDGPSLFLVGLIDGPGTLATTGAGMLSTVFTYANTSPPVTAAAPQIVGGTSVAVSGNGTAIIHTVADGLGGMKIDTIVLSGTTGTSKLVINGTPGTVTTIDRIVIANPLDEIGSIILGTGVLLGNGVRDSVTELEIAGKVGKLHLYDLNSYAYIDLGAGLPYNARGTKTPDTYNHHPELKIHSAGPGILIDVTGDGTPGETGGVGGGGLGKVLVDNWNSTGLPGAIRTTQSIGSFKLLRGDCTVVFEVDKFHHGTSTTAGVGDMVIQDGDWGSTGSEIEGGVRSFDADGFRAGATLTAASMGVVKIGAHGFAGVLRLTDPDGAGVPTFTVNSNFTGSVFSESPLRKLKVKGDFMGTIEAPFIGSITAYSFLGGSSPHHLMATDGSLGTLTATVGGVSDFTISATQVFKGISVKLGKLNGAGVTVGIDRVRVTALSIGSLAVSLAAAATGAGGMSLVGIRDSDFTTTGAGSTKTTLGGIGSVSVTLAGALGGGSAMGIQDSLFDALVTPASVNPLGRIAVKITGQPGASVGLENVEFFANSIGAIALSVSKGAGGTAHAIEVADFTATGAIGALSIDGDASSAQVHDLQVWAGATVGAVTVKSKDLLHGTLQDSAILAGQSLLLTASSAPELLAALAKASLGAVNVTGSIANTQLVAGSSIGAVTAGKNLTDSLILAGARLGDDYALGGLDDTYQRAAAIAAVTVKGAFARTSIIAGVDPHLGGFGDGDDTAALAGGGLSNTSSIGPITLSSGALAGVTGTPLYAIQAARIASLKLGAALPVGITGAQLLDNEVMVKLVA